MKKILLLQILILLTSQLAWAFDLDMTVDDDIRKNYNSSKLVKDTHTEDNEETLPALPEISKYKEPELTVKQETYTPPTQIYNKGNKKIHDSHQPQITCNGGLVVIRVRSMHYKEQIIPINAYITKAGAKKVFLNNIKGNRTYIKTTWKKGNWGRTIFNKMMTLTINLGGEGSTFILSPFPLAYGTICLGLNTLTSPICAFFQKGGHVSIPAGSKFTIRLLDDAFID